MEQINPQQPFRILAIDGGGLRGVYAVHILTRMQEQYGLSFADHFDLITGTSTGAIIAAALALGDPIGEVRQLYLDHAKAIFTRRFSARGFLRSLYGKQELRTRLEELFGERRLEDAKTRLLIPATDITNGTVHVFKSPYLESFVRDRRVRVADAVMASCSAPVYFDPEVVGDYLLVDGGLWANNPSLVSIVEATGKLGVPVDTIRLLSFGTGTGDHRFSLSRLSRPWGIIGWGPRRLVDLIFGLQSGVSSNMVSLLLPQAQRMRVDYTLERQARLDNYHDMPDLRARADRDFTHRSDELRNFLDL